MLYAIFTILVETIIVIAVGSFVFYVSINLSRIGKRRTQTPKYSPMVKNSGEERPDFITKMSDILLAYKIRRKTRFSKKFDNGSSVLGDFFFALRDLYGMKSYKSSREGEEENNYYAKLIYKDGMPVILFPNKFLDREHVSAGFYLIVCHIFNLGERTITEDGPFEFTNAYRYRIGWFIHILTHGSCSFHHKFGIGYRADIRHPDLL